ncbi:Acetyltransferase (GNAT) family protein [Desulfatibacillum alkenivorans DSM 16219]|jgi:ribosomal protein S18 acetylase RimI-like enzyme|uniref:Acetyltransferase (GNAT) family protein n=1 Tax=Desulfatibacillum alkenivorans DSM 16219 TaxID=1121393 RepID=A0A1M6KHD4_9BACT|nr:GNAT family N-acetyltransferase [Desulfatibacillum alkenivorans]SHJ58321.1 Acetyltransferase (GNAT) family protein [Desulfatibacillum alkenivorans DSM 16219]
MMDSVHIIETAPSEAPMDLLLQADPSESKIKVYLNRSRCFIAALNGESVGACIVQPIAPGVHELMNISVAPSHQKMGIGGKLLRHVIESIRDAKAERLEVGTGTFGYQLAFYQREGFRVDSIDKDFFLLNYEEPIYEDGIQLKDMLRLAITFTK